MIKKWLKSDEKWWKVMKKKHIVKKWVGQWVGGGRPQKYTPKSLNEKAQEYFDKCDATVLAVNDKTGMVTHKPKTLSGLCLWLWVEKTYISEKAKNEKFSKTIKELRSNVENCIEEWILTWSYSSTPGIFNLKNNFGWRDQKEISWPNGWPIQTQDLTVKLPE